MLESIDCRREVSIVLSLLTESRKSNNALKDLVLDISCAFVSRESFIGCLDWARLHKLVCVHRNVVVILVDYYIAAKGEFLALLKSPYYEFTDELET